MSLSTNLIGRDAITVGTLGQTGLARRGTVPKLTLQDQMLELCQMTTECLGIQHNVPLYSPAQTPRYICLSATKELIIPGCEGTGRVYLLDPDGKLALRISMDSWSYDHSGCEKVCKIPRHFDCQGRRWVPNPELRLYVMAVLAIWRPVVRNQGVRTDLWSTANSHIEDIVSAITESIRRTGGDYN